MPSVHSEPSVEGSPSARASVSPSGRAFVLSLARAPGVLSRRTLLKGEEFALGDAKISDLRLQLSDLRVDLFDCGGHDAFPYVDGATAGFQFGWTEMADFGDHEMARALS
ncbi:protein of unknown function (plasmid) [Methylocella tundrae]|uniref:Uncharacterized protein n=1 Tax=Methylocella tundrae TaxID=227605 RepID=A0A4U8Z7S6_METTU|nr:protein of unknown function [Methylocella tundrae]